jgi:hypothetical protein
VGDGSRLVHIDTLIVSGNVASSHISSPLPMAKGDGLLDMADAYMGDFNGETNNDKTVRSGPKSHKLVTKPKSVTKSQRPKRQFLFQGLLHQREESLLLNLLCQGNPNLCDLMPLLLH